MNLAAQQYEDLDRFNNIQHLSDEKYLENMEEFIHIINQYKYFNQTDKNKILNIIKTTYLESEKRIKTSPICIKEYFVIYLDLINLNGFFLNRVSENEIVVKIMFHFQLEDKKQLESWKQFIFGRDYITDIPSIITILKNVINSRWTLKKTIFDYLNTLAIHDFCKSYVNPYSRMKKLEKDSELVQDFLNNYCPSIGLKRIDHGYFIEYEISSPKEKIFNELSEKLQEKLPEDKLKELVDDFNNENETIFYSKLDINDENTFQTIIKNKNKEAFINFKNKIEEKGIYQILIIDSKLKINYLN